MRKGIIIRALILALILSLIAIQADTLDYPHNSINDIGCGSCHYIYGSEASLLLEGLNYGQNIDDTQYNALCWTCHNDSIAPHVKTHSSLQIDNSYGDWTVECRVCHNPHYQKQFSTYKPASYLYSGISTSVTTNTLTKTGAGWSANVYEDLVLIPNVSNGGYGYKIVSNTSDTITVEGPIDLSKVTAGTSTFAIIYGKIIKNAIILDNITNPDPARSGTKTVKFFNSTGTNSFADGNSTRDGVCEVCHVRTTHFRNDGSGSDQLHTNVGAPAGTDCTQCHTHVRGFAHGNANCIECHGHDAGTNYDPDKSAPYSAGGSASQGKGSTQSHSTHTEFSGDDLRGPGVYPGATPGVYCDTCHNINKFPTFKSGTDTNGDGVYSLSETDVCDTCHSPGGTYDGVNDPVLGAKNNWKSGIYESDGTLKAGKEKWCATCHDESPSQIQSVNAPNVVGDEAGSYTYGTGWGFYKTGHGLPTSQKYPASGGVTVGAGKGCLDCHDSTTAHIDGNVRTYDDHDSSSTSPSEYRQGYRLKLINGQEPMTIPKLGGTDSTKYRLCLSCHTETPFINSGNLDTNYRNGTTNLHYYHLNVNDTMRFKADWGSGGDYSSHAYTSRITCVVCHNVHGSTRLAMIRDGKLINREPGINIWYYNSGISTNSNPPQPENLPLSASTGSLWLPGSAGNVCYACHGGTSTEIKTRNPFQNVAMAPDLSWTGETNYTGDGVDPDSGASASNFTFRVKYTDTNNDAPSYMELWVDENDNGTYEAGEKYAMSAVSPADVIYTDGKLYYKTLSINKAGDNVISYRFYASDGTDDATGAPVSGGSITISNNTPVLSWTGEENYISDGVNPDAGGNGTSFEFRIKYTDADNTAPGSIEVWVDTDDSGTYEAGEKYAMTGVNGSDTTYSDGKLYTKSLTLAYAGDGVLKYRFYASDGTADATGSPASDSTMIVQSAANNPPSLDWVAATCLTNGAKPAEGPNGGDFEFKVRYTDLDNQCPPTANDIQVWIDINDNSTYDAGEKYNLTEDDASDTTCSDGKLYKVTRALSLAGDNIFNYRFYASDGTDTATGNPISNNTVTVIDALKVRPSGGSGWYSTIQTAVDAISGAHTVLVYEGTYNEKVTFSGSSDSNVSVRSVCGADTTIIDATGKTYGVSVGSNSTGSTVKGFQIINGTAGVYVSNAGITVDSCKIHDNTQGISYIDDTAPQNTPLVVRDSELYDNHGGSGGAIYIKNGSDPHHQIINTVIRDNTAVNGGGAYLGGVVDITGSTIRDNSVTANGGGLYISGVVSLVRSSIIGNSAVGNGGGASLPDADTLTMENSVMADNTAAVGGGVWVDGSLTAVNSTITNNEATGASGGGAFYTNTWVTIDIKNSIVWNNFASGAMQKHIASVSSTSTMTVIDSIVSNDGDGVYNDYPYVVVASGGSATFSGYLSEQDPFFADVSNGDYHIKSNSPAIDVANSTYAPADDIDGDVRPQGSADDIGADEYTSSINTAPVLSWSGETNYGFDGVSPDSAVGGSSFEFRINYADADNDAPSSIQVWVDTNDNGSYEESEKYSMSAVNTDAVYSDGKLYTKSLTLSYAGNGVLNYRFYASDGTSAAKGVPTSDSALTIINSAPTLSWTGEANYVSDGVNPDSGMAGSNFEFRVDYTDVDNTAPSYIEVWVDEDDSGVYDFGEKYGMTATDGGDDDYTDGKRYTKTLTLANNGDGILKYKFAASDGSDPATGTPTTDSTVTVSNVTVSFTSASQSTANESGTATITAQLSAVSGLDVTVPFTVNGSSTATGGSTDYSITASPIIITAGNTTANITVTIASDSLDENDETVIVDMGIPTNAAQGAITSHTVTITDDDPMPTVSFTSASQSTANESGTATITAQLSAVSGRDVTVPFTVNGSSTATGGGTDYSITASPITITAGNLTADITVTVATDSIDENNETVIVDMGSPTNATQGATITHTVTITDDDDEPTVTFTSASQATANESGTATITAQLSAVSGRNVTVPFTVNGSSTAAGGGTDYSITASPVTITAGNTTANITVTVTGDSLPESNETVIVDMGAPTNATQGAITTHTVTITDDDPVGGTIYTVCKAGHADAPCNYQSINGGIDSATVQNGDTLLVSADTYSENINFDGKNITIQSKAGAATTTIQGDGTNNPVVKFITSETSAAVLDGFTINNQAANTATRGVYISGATPTIKNSIIEGNSANNGTNGGGGVYVDNSIPTFDNCTIRSNTATNRNGGGMYITGAAGGATITNSTIGGSGTVNSANLGGGIYFTGSTTGTLSISGSTIAYNTTTQPGAGVYITGITNTTTFTNTSINNNTASQSAGGIYSNGSPLSFTNCNINNNATGSTASYDGGGIYLTGAAASATISGGTINGNSGRYGGGIYITGSTAATPLSISNLTMSSNTGYLGGAVYLTSVTNTVTVAGTTISGNTGQAGGGGIYNNAVTLDISSSHVDSNNVPNSSQKGGGLYLAGAVTTTVTNTTVDGNSASGLGGGIYVGGSTLQFTGSSISSNTVSALSGGGIAADGASVITLAGVTIRGNKAYQYGGGIYFASSSATASTINNCTITGNTHTNTSSLDGGGIYVNNTAINIINSTIAGNYAYRYGGGIRVQAGTVNIKNSILYGNTAGTSGSQISGSPTVSYSDIEGTFAGTGNIDSDPLFTSFVAGDKASNNTPKTTGNFHIQSGSPCKNTGNNADAPADTDIDGDTRIINTTVDMGSDEYNNSTQTVTLHPSGLASEGSGNFAPTGGVWADVLDIYDSGAYVSVCCQGFGTFYVDMDNTGIGGSPTINSVTIKVVVKNSAAANVDIGYKTGTAVIWKGDTSVGTSYTTLTLNAATDSDGGPWSVADLDNLKVAVLRNYTGPTTCYVTEVAVEINYTP